MKFQEKNQKENRHRAAERVQENNGVMEKKEWKKWGTARENLFKETGDDRWVIEA